MKDRYIGEWNVILMMPITCRTTVLCSKECVKILILVVTKCKSSLGIFEKYDIEM